MKAIEEIPLITTAGSLHAVEKKRRERKYFIMMSCRLPALFLATYLACLPHLLWLGLIIVGISIPLPWIAVLLANDRPAVKKRKPSAVIQGRP